MPRVFGLGGSVPDDGDNWLLNHFFSISKILPSSLSPAIALDISWTKGEPFLKAYDTIIYYKKAYTDTRNDLILSQNNN